MMKIMHKNKRYWVQFVVEDEEKAEALLGKIISHSSEDIRNDVEKQFGVKFENIGWADWKEEVRKIREFLNDPQRPIP